MGKIVVTNGVASVVNETAEDLASRARDAAAWQPPTADQVKQQRIDTIQEGVLTIGHEHENRIRALEGKNPVTLAQFKAAVKARLT